MGSFMIILGWNRDYEDETWPEYQEDRAWLVRERGSITTTWTVGQKVNIEVDEPCFIYAQGVKHPKGILAFGRVVSEPEARPHYDASRAAKGDTTNWISWEIFAMLPKNDPIPRDILEERVPEVRWRNIYGSGYFVPAGSEAALMDLFCEYCPELLEE
jgi:hypothetical protein